MDNFNFTFNNMDEVKSIFTNAASDNEETTSTATESFAPSDNRRVEGSVFSALAPPFQSRINGNISTLAPQEPQVGDTAPPLEIDMMNLRINDTDSLFEGRSEQNARNYFMGSRAESVASMAAPGNIWSENSSSTKTREMFENFEFFLKTLSSANTYLSMLTREQTMVLQSFSPSLLVEFFQEVGRIRGDKRMQRALSHECAFCKNNGENEENYTSHALKDWKGRVQCPVLRAFRCPRCGATGDRAHTIKYCPANDNGMLQRQGLRRRFSSNSFNFGETSRIGSNAAPATPATPAQSPSASSAFSTASFWSNFGMN